MCFVELQNFIPLKYIYIAMQLRLGTVMYLATSDMVTLIESILITGNQR